MEKLEKEGIISGKAETTAEVSEALEDAKGSIRGLHV